MKDHQFLPLVHLSSRDFLVFYLVIPVTQTSPRPPGPPPLRPRELNAVRYILIPNSTEYWPFYFFFFFAFHKKAWTAIKAKTTTADHNAGTDIIKQMDTELAKEEITKVDMQTKIMGNAMGFSISRDDTIPFAF